MINPNTFKTIIVVFGYVLVFFGGAYHFTNYAWPAEPPLREYQDRYEMKIGKSVHFPFAYKYYLFTPPSYDPQKKYPLVLLLHGASRHMKNTGYLTGEELQNVQPVFVVVPIAPPRTDWGNSSSMQASALPLALDAVQSVQSDYNIDADRIYVSGYSMGGFGALNAVAQYKDVFAAALPLCGYWDTKNIGALTDIPIWMFHGSEDTIIPPEASRKVYRAAQDNGLENIRYTELEDLGHNIWHRVYETPRLWLWLFSHKKNP